MKSIIEVEINNIWVDNWYYGFDYVITIDGKEKLRNTHESDHAWHNDQKGFMEYLQEGGAVKTALEQLL